jgi:hypothetical protein
MSHVQFCIFGVVSLCFQANDMLPLQALPGDKGPTPMLPRPELYS